MPMTTAGGGGGNTPQIMGPAWEAGTKTKSPKTISLPVKKIFFMFMMLSSFITLAFACCYRINWEIFKWGEKNI
jgi:hypothetical protein